MAGEDKKTPAPGDVDADSVVRQLGQAGRFHMRVYVLMALAAVQVGLLHTTYIFLAAGVPYSFDDAQVTLKGFLQEPVLMAHGADVLHVGTVIVKVGLYCKYAYVYKFIKGKCVMSKLEGVMEKSEEKFAGSAGVDMEQLMQELGQARRFHLGNYALLALTVFVAALYATNYVFLAADVPYRYSNKWLQL
ncbi:hypothetical protein HF086_005417 [Spodoptera exigua]|uniref:Uncharacterized protein n=1 Tax=Spodoptera exigua TaxID=7107 RepID=A0A922SEB2_SPOEX|nr:hypothetical protein HF086_005417 [Spodoptera exigua]